MSLHLFEGFGVELEYMIVSRGNLSVLPVCDRLLYSPEEGYRSEVEQGPLCWSNELVLHVVELKTNGPAPRLEDLAALFQKQVAEINERLAAWEGRLMPTAMHPWMDPRREMHLWPHEYSPVYEAYNRIFGCAGHGWANLQSTHLNLPFQGDEEFGRLHAAIRLVLPLLPALAASSPILEGRPTGLCDSRLEVYRTNSRRIPSVTGAVIPEPVFTREDYQREILEKMYRDIAPLDPEGVLRHEWLNSRGAIARFDRHSIEVRVLDIQECPAADLSILILIVKTLRALVEERWCSYREQRRWKVAPLYELLQRTIREGDGARVDNGDYLKLFGLPPVSLPAGEVWRHLAGQLLGDALGSYPHLQLILEEGCLARRMLRRLPEPWSREELRRLAEELCECLRHGSMLHAQPDSDQL